MITYGLPIRHGMAGNLYKTGGCQQNYCLVVLMSVQLGHAQVWFACGCMTGYIQVHVGVGNYSLLVIVLKGITWNCLSAWVQHFLCLYSLQALISGWAVSNGFPTCIIIALTVGPLPCTL